MKRIFIVSTTVATVFATAIGNAAFAGEVTPKISMDDAQKIALEQVKNGEIIEAELENEHDKWQYAIDVKKADGKVMDIEIDANTGEVLQVKEDD